MLPTLKPEILLVVFEQLRQPLPKPHSSQSDRSVIRQSGLTPLLRVSKSWYNLAGIPLYNVVVTDDLESFLYGSENVIPGIIPKSSLLQNVRRLYIEYGAKHGIVAGAMKDPSIWSKGKNVIWNLGYGRELHEEYISLQRALEMLSGSSGTRGGALTFPRLRTLSVGAFFGFEEEFTQARCRGTDMWKTYGREIMEVKESFQKFVESCKPSIQHYCQSPSNGPLSLTGFSSTYKANPPRPGVHSPSIYSNHSSSSIMRITVPIAISVKWYVHHSHPSKMLLSQLETEISTYGEFRSMIVAQSGQLGQGKPTPVTSFDCTIYRKLPVTEGSGGPTKTKSYKAACRKETVDMQTSIDVVLAGVGMDPSRSGQAVDRVDVISILEAPPCAACGWRYK